MRCAAAIGKAGYPRESQSSAHDVSPSIGKKESRGNREKGTGGEMKLNATVEEVRSANRYGDGHQRLRLRFPDAMAMDNTLVVANTDGWQLDDELEVTVTKRVKDTSDVPFLQEPAYDCTGQQSGIQAPLSLTER